MATLAPDAMKRSVMARPMPRAPPVTMAERPARSIWFMGTSALSRGLASIGFGLARARWGCAHPAATLMVVARHAERLGDLLVFHRILQHAALVELADIGAVDLLPGRLVDQRRQLQIGAAFGQLFIGDE